VFSAAAGFEIQRPINGQKRMRTMSVKFIEGPDCRIINGEVCRGAAAIRWAEARAARATAAAPAPAGKLR
jgi:hypothetical protein